MNSHRRWRNHGRWRHHGRHHRSAWIHWRIHWRCGGCRSASTSTATATTATAATAIFSTTVCTATTTATVEVELVERRGDGGLELILEHAIVSATLFAWWNQRRARILRGDGFTRRNHRYARILLGRSLGGRALVGRAVVDGGVRRRCVDPEEQELLGGHATLRSASSMAASAASIDRTP